MNLVVVRQPGEQLALSSVCRWSAKHCTVGCLYTELLQLVCSVCGKRGADTRPDFSLERKTRASLRRHCLTSSCEGAKREPSNAQFKNGPGPNRRGQVSIDDDLSLSGSGQW
jgi:hypothetical protein